MAYWTYLKNICRDTDAENECMDTKWRGEWGELGDWG